MASTLRSAPDQPNSHKSRVIKRRVITSTWLIIALLISALTLAVWVFSAAPAFAEKSETVDEPSIEESVLNIGQIDHIDNIRQLEDAVQPISFDTLVKDLRDYPPEFKDFKYLKENQGKWTVQVMDVSEHEVITDYLSSRKDRKKFAYFRYRDNDNQARYLLTYGAMASPQMAMGAAKTIDFKLPANVRVLPEEIDRYLDLIENYELSTGAVKDLSTDGAREVKLQPASKQLAAKKTRDEKAQEADSKSVQDTNQAPVKSNSNASPNAVATNKTKSAEKIEAIKGSTDTAETLSMTENRKLVDTSKSNTPKVSNDVLDTPEATVTSPEVQQPPVPLKPDTVKSSKPNSSENDAIKELIESTEQ